MVRFEPIGTPSPGPNVVIDFVLGALRVSVVSPVQHVGYVRVSPMPMTSQIIIPARLASTRLPRKLLLAETGKPLIQHTYESALRATLPAGICVATDMRRYSRRFARLAGKWK